MEVRFVIVQQVNQQPAWIRQVGSAGGILTMAVLGPVKESGQRTVGSQAATEDCVLQRYPPDRVIVPMRFLMNVRCLFIF